MGTRGEGFTKADLLEYAGTDHYTNGRYDLALEAYQEAVKLFAQVRSERPHDDEVHYRFASATNNTGSVLFALGAMEAARDAFTRAMVVFGEIWDRNPSRPAFGNDFAACVNNVGHLISFSDKPAAAEKFFIESLRIRDAVRAKFPYDKKAVVGWGLTAMLLAGLYDKLGKTAEATHAREQARKCREALDGPPRNP